MEKNNHEEVFKVSGDDLIKKVKELLKEGSVTRIIIKNDKDETIMEMPLAVGAVGAIVSPMLAAIGAMAALITNCTVVVMRKKRGKE